MNFEFAIIGNPSDELSRIKSEAAEKNIIFIGDAKEGTFTGGAAMFGKSLKGIYGIAGDRMLVTVLDKPSDVSWQHVKTMLKNFIEK